MCRIPQSDFPYPLYCDDIGTGLDDPEKPEPVWSARGTGGCTDFTLTFADVTLTEDGDCGSLYITRTFTAVDELKAFQGPDRATDQLSPVLTIEDVVLPPRTAPIECDEAFSRPTSLATLSDFTGYPFIVTASGIVDLRDFLL